MKAGLFIIISALTLMTWACGGSDSTVNLNQVPGIDGISIQDGVQADADLDNIAPADARTPGEAGELKPGCKPEACQVGNEHGTCEGWRYCDLDGLLLPCNAAPATVERCDGLDNDCDGLVDEDVECDDGNPCTLDQCVEGQCRHQGQDGDACDDEDPCTREDACHAGTCTGPEVDCDDGDLCTDDRCADDGECEHTSNQAVCDDDDPCTLGDYCRDGLCRGTPVDCECLGDEDCAALEDGNLCNGTLVCDQSTVPARCVVAAGTVIDCPAPAGVDSTCLRSTCEPETGECGYEPAAEGEACINQDLCTIGDVCQDGKCVDGPAANCRDDNPCTDDSCDPTTGCLNQPNSLPCEDGSACTMGDICANGACAPGPELSCDDANPCTSDTCDPTLGCQHAAAAGGCDDLNLCTVGDFCNNGQCHPGEPRNCNDNNPCTTDSCHAVGGCMNLDSNTPCDDSNPFTLHDICLDGICTGEPLDCNDYNPCTDDELDQDLGCLHTLNQDPCDDQNLCTLGDRCEGGTCMATSIEYCDDQDACTDDFCDPLSGCLHSFNTKPCDDRNACTTGDTCGQGQCVGGSVVCNDGNPCTDDACNPASGCVFSPNHEACDDGNDCTTEDTCTGEVCAGLGDLDCDDGNPCTRDICLIAGGCDHQLMDDTACSDGDPCTENDRCLAGQCISGSARFCDDGNPCTDDSCNSSGTCVHTPNQAPCDDDNLCTLGDTCSGGICTPSSRLDCGDEDVCTTDSCDPARGCIHQANTLPCDDGDLCTVGDLCVDRRCKGTSDLNCSDGNLCTDDECDPGQGCVHLNNQVECDDADPCTVNDTCKDAWCKGTVALVCGDGILCGAEVCDDGNDDPCDGCAACQVHTNTCGDQIVCGPETCDDGNSFTWDGCRDCSINGYIGNGTTFGIQIGSQIIPAADDGFLLLFSSSENMGTTIWGRFFDSEGMPEGDDFHPTTTTDTSHSPAGALLADGTFIIIWVNGTNADLPNIYGQRLSREGALLGEMFMINADPADICGQPVVKARSDRGFIVTWMVSLGGGDYEIMAQRFSQDNAREGEELVIGTANGSWGTRHDLAVFSDDSFIIAWSSNIQSGDGYNVWAKQFQADGTPISQKFRIPNLSQDSSQENPAVSVLQDDSFVVAWQTTINTTQDIHFQRFSYDRTPLYDEVKVNQNPEFHSNAYPSIAVMESGLIFVMWHSVFGLPAKNPIRARLMSPDASYIGDVFSVSDRSWSSSPAKVASFTDGKVSVTWTDSEQPESWDFDIYIMRYDEDMNPVYR